MSVYNGTSGSDILPASGNADFSDQFNGYGGDDYIVAGGGSDLVYGGDGDDIIFASDYVMDVYKGGADTIYGGAGNDRIWMGPGVNTLYGEDGDDTFISQGVGGARFFGGAGTDVILLKNYNGWNGGHGTESLLQIDEISGVEAIISQSSLPSYIVTEGGTFDFRQTKIQGFSGIRGDGLHDDTIYAGVFDYGTGIYFGANVDGQGGNDNLFGTFLGDVLNGGAGDDLISGGSGADAMSGGSGNDTLYGGLGNDTLTGGAGSDLFWFDAGQGTDTVTDWVNGVDKFVLGSAISGVNLYNSGGNAVLDLVSGSSHTYVLLSGVSPSLIDASDFMWV